MAENLLSLLGDDQLIKKVQGTHASGVDKQADMKPIMLIVEDIMNRAKPVSAQDNTSQKAQTPSHDLDASGDKALKETSATAAYIALESPINYASYMITWKCVGGVDEDSVTMELLTSVLSKYSWDAKAVIAYAAFAINYGEFWLLQNPNRSQLAQNMATLMGFPNNLETDTWKAAMDLLTLLMELIHCIIAMNDIPPNFKNIQQTEIQLSVYWIISSLVVCASLFADMFCNNYKSSSVDEAKEKISKLGSKLFPVLQDWGNQVQIYCEKIEYDKAFVEFQTKVMSPNAPHIDNMEVLNALFHPINDQRQLYNGSTATKETLDVLKQKHVLLLITNLDPSPTMLRILRRLYDDSSTPRSYEIVWLPIVDPKTESLETKFENLRNNMPWFSMEHPLAIEAVFVRYILTELHFAGTPMLVVFDPTGRLVHRDALPMVLIWGANTAFPFTTERETSLWSESLWNIQLIFGNVDSCVQEWIKTNKVICLYGGDNIDWVRKFTLSARTAAQALGAPLEMLYVGRHNPEEKVRICHEVTTVEKLSHKIATDCYDYISYFWMRLANIWYSKIQTGKTVENDDIMREVMDLLTYDSSEQGWAIFSRGNNEITMEKGDKVVAVLDSYDEWANEVDQPEKFVCVLDKYLRSHQQEHHCNRLILPGNAGSHPDTVLCADCGKIMEKYIMYRCCTE